MKVIFEQIVCGIITTTKVNFCTEIMFNFNFSKGVC